VGIPNVVQRTYHSMASAAGATALGHQWQLSVGADTSLAPQPTSDAIYVDPTGQGYDIPSAVSATVPGIAADATTQGNWIGAYGHDGYVLNAWNNGTEISALPSYVSGYSHPAGAQTLWQTGTTDSRALQAPGQPGRNAAALTASIPPTQTQQIVTFNTRSLITASVYLLNWAGSSMSETVQMQDAAGTHSYYAAGPPVNNGLWVRFTNLRVGPTQPLTVTVTGDPGSTAASSALTFDGNAPNGFGRAQGLPADLAQRADGSYALTFNSGLTELFSGTGQYSGASERHGNTERYLYNGGAGGSCPTTQIGAIRDTVGRTTTFNCNGSGIVTGIADPDNRNVSYGYDGSNNLTSFTDHAGGVTRYSYNTAGLPATILDPIGNQTIITYDASLHVSAVQDGAGSVTSFSYGLTNTNTTTVTNALGAQTIFTYDPATGAMLSLTDPNGNITRSSYDGNMLLQTTTDPLGHVITNTTTGGSDQTGSIDPLGIGTSTSYNSLHEPVVITDTQGQATTTHYNAFGDPITITDPLSYTTIMTPGANGLALARTDGNGHTTRYDYDAFGDTVAVTDALNRVSTMVYDTNIGRLSAVTDPKLQTTTLGYDPEDRLLQTTYQDHSVTQNLIDADGNITETVDSAGATLFTYDGDNRLIQQTYPDGAVVGYTYDAAGRPRTKSKLGLPTTTYGYDAGGRLKTVSNGLLGQFTYSYDAASRLTALGYPNGITTTYNLDNDNRVIGLSEVKGTNTLLGDSFSYVKPDGTMGSQRMAETRTDNGVASSWAYGYDVDARLTGATVTGTVATPYGYGYDAVGNMTSNNGVAQRYDAANQITAAGSITYTFDNNGQQTGASQGALPAWLYDAQGHTTGYSDLLSTATFQTTAGRQRATKAVAPAPAASAGGYRLSFLGAATHGPATGTGTITYGDGSTQPYTLTLSDWTLGGGGQAVAAGTSIAATTAYRDTSGGQASASKAYLFVASVPLQAGKAVSKVTLPNQPSLHLFALTAAPAQGAANLQPFYNNAGTASDGTAGGANLDGVGYAYSAQALRAAGVARGGPVVANGMTFQWPGAAPGAADNVVAQGQVVAFSATQAGTFDGDMYRQTSPVSRTLYYVRDPRGRLLAVTDGATVYYYGLDGHGSVATLTDSNGAVVNAYRYDPYGNSLGMTETATLPNPWRYAGGYLDAESGLYLLGARYYAPQLGRFLQPDPLGTTDGSQYAYAESDPCNNSDPTGLASCEHIIPAGQIHAVLNNLRAAQDLANWIAAIGGAITLFIKGAATAVDGGAGGAGGAGESPDGGGGLGDGAGRVAGGGVAVSFGLQKLIDQLAPYEQTGAILYYHDPGFFEGTPWEQDFPCLPAFDFSSAG